MNWNKAKIAAGFGGAATAIMGAVLAFAPQLAGWLFLIMGKVFVIAGLAFGGLSAWFFRSSDETHERAIWGVILLVIIIAGAALAGISLAAYWQIFLVIGLILLAGVIWGLYRYVTDR
jgi:hypothetical protein